MYRHHAGNVSDMGAVMNLAKGVESYGRGGYDVGDGQGILFRLERRIHIAERSQIVIPATTSSKAVNRLLAQSNRSKDVVDMEHDGHMYRVWKTESGICEFKCRTKADGEQSCMFNTSEDGGHRSEGTFTAYVCYDSRRFSDEVQAHKTMINYLLKVAEGVVAKDPVKVFSSKARKVSKHFEFEVDGRGLKTSVKQNLESFRINRAGLSVMLSSKDIDRHTVMRAVAQED